MPPVKASHVPIHIHAPFLDAASDLFLSCLSHDGGSSISVHQCISHVLKILRIPSTAGVRSVSLYLDHMDGVAYTKGSDLDNAHKEIHFNVSYFASLQPPRPSPPTSTLQHMTLVSPTPLPQSSKVAHGGGSGGGDGASAESTVDAVRFEVMGVLTHELVHCFQFDGKGSLPSGLIEGIADFVRLRAQLGPQHWRRGGEKWDDGYANTAYFLDWCDVQHGDGQGGFVSLLNESHRDLKWSEDWFTTYTGHSVQQLWDEYRKTW